MSRPKYYWYGFIRKTISHYPDGLPDTEAGIIAMDAIESALEETRCLADGKDRVDAVYMVCIRKTHTFEGAALVLHTSPRTIQRYIRNFVYLVAQGMGFT